jgi:hypothetical protein
VRQNRTGTLSPAPVTDPSPACRGTSMASLRVWSTGKAV